MKDLNIVFAGFGGQGILFAGKVVAYAGLIEGRELSWLPSYGPEMRGGTANCSICLSDEPIGSPLVTNPNVLIAMNRPSLAAAARRKFCCWKKAVPLKRANVLRPRPATA